MAVYVNQDITYLFGSMSIAGNAKSAVINSTAQSLDTTSLATTGWSTFIGGNKSGDFSLDLMADFDAGTLDDTIWTYITANTDAPQSLAIGSAEGSTAYVWNGLNTAYTPVMGAPGELAMASLSGVANGPIARGMLMHTTGTARTATGTGTARLLGAVTASQRIYANLHVTAASGTTPTLVVKVQSDDNAGFTSPVDRITFTTATGKTAQATNVAGAITDTYWRVTWTLTGTTPSFTFGVSAGII